VVDDLRLDEDAHISLLRLGLNPDADDRRRESFAA